MKRALRDLPVEWRTMLTVTYPAQHLVTEAVAYLQFRELCRKIRHQHGETSILWIKEFTKQGQIHYHALCSRFIHHASLARLWWLAAGKISSDHLKAGTSIEKLKNGIKGASSYINKYACKQEQKQRPAHRSDPICSQKGGVRGRKWWGYSGCPKMVAATTKNDKKVILLEQIISEIMSKTIYADYGTTVLEVSPDDANRIRSAIKTPC